MPITEEDEAKVEQLRSLVKDELTPYYDTDFNLLRWLKGHDYNLDIIVPKLLNHLKFRKSDWKLDDLAMQKRNHVVHKHWKAGLTGPAVLTPNTIVNIEQSGGNDYWGMMKTHPMNEILRARVHDLEGMLKAVMDLEKETGEQCSVLYIMDLTGLVMDRHTVSLMTGGLAAISAFMVEHYVEMVHSFVLVNVPTFISAIWSIARPILPEKTRQKVNIMGGSWREEILKITDASTLPTYWNKEGEDGPFHGAVERGLPFDPAGYYKTETDFTHLTLMSVPAGKSGYFDVEVEQNQKVSWEVHANGHFSFCVYVLEDKKEETYESLHRAYPLCSKVPGPTMVPCLDSLTAERTGTLRFVFGNQHAWFHTLKLHYKITIE